MIFTWGWLASKRVEAILLAGRHYVILGQKQESLWSLLHSRHQKGTLSVDRHSHTMKGD